jgi:hypothetical protein
MSAVLRRDRTKEESTWRGGVETDRYLPGRKKRPDAGGMREG